MRQPLPQVLAGPSAAEQMLRLEQGRHRPLVDSVSPACAVRDQASRRLLVAVLLSLALHGLVLLKFGILSPASLGSRAGPLQISLAGPAASSAPQAPAAASVLSPAPQAPTARAVRSERRAPALPSSSAPRGIEARAEPSPASGLPPAPSVPSVHAAPTVPSVAAATAVPSAPVAPTVPSVQAAPTVPAAATAPTAAVAPTQPAPSISPEKATAAASDAPASAPLATGASGDAAPAPAGIPWAVPTGPAKRVEIEFEILAGIERRIIGKGQHLYVSDSGDSYRVNVKQLLEADEAGRDSGRDSGRESAWQLDIAGRITRQGLSPALYETRGDLPGRLLALKEPADPAAAERPAAKAVRGRMPDGILDRQSLLYHFMLLPPADGGGSLWLTDGMRHALYTYRIAGSEALTIAALGVVRTVRLEFSASGSSETIELWLIPDLRYLPARVRHTDPRGTITEQVVTSLDFK